MPKNQRGYTPLSIVLAGIIFFGIGALALFLIVHKNTPPKIAPLPSTSPLPSQNYVIPFPSTSDTAAATANWLPIINTQYGYSIKYPGSLYYTNSNFAGIGGQVTLDQWARGQDYTVLIYSYSQGVSPKLDQIDKSQFNAAENIQIDGAPTIKLVSNDGTQIRLGPIDNEDSEFFIIYKASGPKVDSTTFNQMMSTFTFLNPNETDTSSWSEFENSMYDYTIKYPQDYSPFIGGSFSAATGTEGSIDIENSTITQIPTQPFVYINVVPQNPFDTSKLTFQNDKFEQNVNSYLGSNIGDTITPDSTEGAETFLRMNDLTINGITYQMYQGSLGNGVNDRRLVVLHNGFIYLIGTYFVDKDDQYSLYQEILSTFQFTN